MKQMVRSVLCKLSNDEQGQTLVEYGLLLLLLVIAVAAVVFVLGGNLKMNFTDVSNCLQNPSSC